MKTALDRFSNLVVGALNFRDALVVASLGAVLIGVSQWSRPLAWVVGGTFGLALWSLPYWRRKAG